MATKTIESMHFYVAIAGYQLPSVPDQTFNCLRVSVGYRKGSGFYASFHPGWGDGSMWGCMFDFSKDPLSAGITVEIEPATKNNAKRIAEMTESLKLAKDIIAALFDDREWQKLKGVLQNAARFGYTEKFKQQGEAYLKGRTKKTEPVVKQVDVMGLMGALQTKGKAKLSDFAKPIESVNENENQNEKAMATNVKAADLIGKTIVVGDNQATIVIKSVDGDKLSGEFTKDGKTTPMSFPMSQLQGMTEKGLWRIANENDNVNEKAAEVTTDADVAEVDDIVPVVTKKPEPAAKVEPIKETVKAEPKPKTKDKTNTNPTNQTNKPKYHVELLPTKDGQKWPKLYGFKDESEAKKTADKMAKTVTYSWDRDEQGEKRYYLKGGKKYCEVFQQLSDALNAGNRAAIERACMASVAIFEGARSEGKKKSEERGKTEDVHQPSNISPQTSTEKTYTQTELAEWLRKLNSGTDKEKAAAAKFFNDLAKAA